MRWPAKYRTAGKREIAHLRKVRPAAHKPGKLPRPCESDDKRPPSGEITGTNEKLQYSREGQERSAKAQPNTVIGIVPHCRRGSRSNEAEAADHIEENDIAKTSPPFKLILDHGLLMSFRTGNGSVTPMHGETLRRDGNKTRKGG